MQLQELKAEAIEARSKLLAWCSRQPTTAVTVQRFTRPYDMLFPDSEILTCTTLRADSYTDRTKPHWPTVVFGLHKLLTRKAELEASMWNTYRQCQLHLANLICRINDSLAETPSASSGTRESRKLRAEIDDYIDDIFASIPFMLAGDTIRYSKPREASWTLPKPPMLLGGLSMQWRLFTIAILDNAPIASKNYARDVLTWFGKALGLGQAKVLAHVYLVLYFTVAMTG